MSLQIDAFNPSDRARSEDKIRNQQRRSLKIDEMSAPNVEIQNSILGTVEMNPKHCGGLLAARRIAGTSRT